MQKLPNGKFKVQLRIGGQVKSFTFTSKRDAEKKELEIKRNQELFRAGMEMPKEHLLFVDFAAHWMRGRVRNSDLAKGTVAQDETRLRRYLIGPLGLFPLAAITSQQIIELLDKIQVTPWKVDPEYKMEDGPLSNATRNRIRALLHRLFRDAYMEGMVTGNPVTRAPLLNERKTQRPKVAPLTLEESYKLVAAAFKRGPSEAFLVIAFLYSGGRVSQICGLKNSDFSVRHREISFNRIMEAQTGEIQNRIKGRPEGIVMPMFDIVIEAFQRHLKHTRFNKPSDYCFPDEHGLPRSTYSVSREIVSLGRDAKIKRPVRPHLLRATFATQAEEASFSKEDIQRMLGHSSVLVTERYTRRGAQPLVDKGHRLGFGKTGDDSEE